MREQPPARLGRRLAGPRLGDALVAGDRDAQARPGAHRARRARPACSGRRSGYSSGRPPTSRRPLSSSATRWPGTGSDSTPTSATSRPVAEPGPLKTWAPRFSQYGARGSLRMRPPSALGALEHDDVAVAQIPGRREAGDAAADHDGVAHGLELAAGGVGGQVAESSAGVLATLAHSVAGHGRLPARGTAAAAADARAARAGCARACSSPSARSRVGVTIWYWISYLRGPSDTPFTRGPVPAARERERGGAALAHARRQGGAASRRSRPNGAKVERRGRRAARPASPTAATRGSRASTARRRRGGSFTTPPAALDRSVRFAVLADYGSGDDNEWAVGRLLAAQRPDFAVTAGDNSYLVAAEVLLDRNIFRPLGDLMASAPMYVCLGDHDKFFPGPGAHQQRLRPARGRALHRAPRADPGRRARRRAERAGRDRVRAHGAAEGRARPSASSSATARCRSAIRSCPLLRESRRDGLLGPPAPLRAPHRRRRADVHRRHRRQGARLARPHEGHARRRRQPARHRRADGRRAHRRRRLHIPRQARHACSTTS